MFLRGRRPSFVPSSNKSKPWQAAVKLYASQEVEEPVDGPVSVTVRCHFARPKSHLTTKGELNAAGKRRPYHTVPPDGDKLLRGILDGLTGVVYVDDKQVVSMTLDKVYCYDEADERAEIEVLYL